MTLATLYWVISIFITLTVLVCAISYAMYICNICNGICGRRRTNYDTRIDSSTNHITLKNGDVTQHSIAEAMDEIMVNGENEKSNDLVAEQNHERQHLIHIPEPTNTLTKGSSGRKSKTKYRAPPIPIPPEAKKVTPSCTLGQESPSNSQGAPSLAPNSSSKTIRTTRSTCCTIDAYNSDSSAFVPSNNITAMNSSDERESVILATQSPSVSVSVTSNSPTGAVPAPDSTTNFPTTTHNSTTTSISTVTGTGGNNLSTCNESSFTNVTELCLSNSSLANTLQRKTKQGQREEKEVKDRDKPKEGKSKQRTSKPAVPVRKSELSLLSTFEYGGSDVGTLSDISETVFDSPNSSRKTSSKPLIAPKPAIV